MQSSRNLGFTPGDALFKGKTSRTEFDIDLTIRWPRDISAHCNLKSPQSIKVGTVLYDEDTQRISMSYTVKSISDTCAEREAAEAFWMTKVQ